MRILISKTEAIGDAIIVSSLAGFLKRIRPHWKIRYLVTKPMVPLLKLCPSIDEVTDPGDPTCYDDVDIYLASDRNHRTLRAAKNQGVPLRITNIRRYKTWLFANSFIYYSKRSYWIKGHEALFSFRYLKQLGIQYQPSINNLNEWCRLQPEPSYQLPKQFKNKRLIALHPGSNKSAREWPVDNYVALAQQLKNHGYTPVLTGSHEEGERFKLFFKNFQCLWGALSLGDLANFYAHCEAVVACSTGPLHIAAAIGTHAVGIYPNRRHIHPKRWRPLGPKVTVIYHTPSFCRATCQHGGCGCMQSISPNQVFETIHSGQL